MSRLCSTILDNWTTSPFAAWLSFPCGAREFHIWDKLGLYFAHKYTHVFFFILIFSFKRLWLVQNNMKEKENRAGTTLTILGDLKLSYFNVIVKEGCSHSLRTQHKYHKS